MTKNIGKADRIARVVVGVIFIVLGIMSSSWIVAAVGIILIATAMIGWCALYTLLKINTCEKP